MPNNIKVLLVGAGYMGREYAKVLKALNVSFDVITRTEKTASIYEKNLGYKPIVDSLDNYLYTGNNNYSHAINCVSAESLAEITKIIIKHNISNILVEKPLALTIDAISDVASIASIHKSNIYIGYNRRYYASTIEAERIALDDGGIRSVNFEFTEWKNKIDFSKFTKNEIDHWLIANSSHVIDLAFFFAGKPVDYCFYSGHTISDNNDIFVGSGITDKNIYFNYSANWDAPGRWCVELLTNKHRLYLRPMEKLFLQDLNSVEINEVAINDKYDIDFKPGIYNEVKDFLSACPTSRLKTINEQLYSIEIYKNINYGHSSKN